MREDFEIDSDHSEVSVCFLMAAAMDLQFNQLQWSYTLRVCKDCGPSYTLGWLPRFTSMAVKQHQIWYWIDT